MFDDLPPMFFHFNVEEPKSEWTKLAVRNFNVGHPISVPKSGNGICVVRETDDLVSVHDSLLVRVRVYEHGRYRKAEPGERGRCIAKGHQIKMRGIVVRNDGGGFVSWRVA